MWIGKEVKMKTRISYPRSWVARKMTIAITLTIVVLTTVLVLEGCASSYVGGIGYEKAYSSDVVPGNGTITVTTGNAPYDFNLFKIGPYGIEGVIIGLHPGGFAVFTSDFTPAYQSITIVATAYYHGNLVGTARRTWNFSSYGSYSYGYTWQLEATEFRISSPSMGNENESNYSVPMGSITREAASILKLGK